MYTHSRMPNNSVFFVCENARAFLRLLRERASESRSGVLYVILNLCRCVSMCVCGLNCFFVGKDFIFTSNNEMGGKQVNFLRKTSTIFPFLGQKNETNGLKSHFTHRNLHRNEYYEIKKIMFNEA